MNMQKPRIALWGMIAAYVGYFSWFTDLRWKTLYSSYFDLGIMHQTVYNTYKALQTLDFGRVLEITDPLGFQQVKRMAIHNDLLLALLSPFFFINSSPSALVVLQTCILALGALATYSIANILFKQFKHNWIPALAFSFAYLMYVPMQQSNIFDFHAVVPATSLLLWMYYFYITRRYKWSAVFFILAVLSKEQVALTTMMFGLLVLWNGMRATVRDKNTMRFGVGVALASLVWFVLAVFVIIPTFRGGDHFASERFSEFGESPKEIVFTVLTNPTVVYGMLAQNQIPKYLNELLGPLGFLSILSPLTLLVALPEFAINALSNNGNMRNIIFHYTAVLQPFIFISAIHGAKFLVKKKDVLLVPISLALVAMSGWYGYTMGPLPFQKQKNIHPIEYPQEERAEVAAWSEKLKDDSIKVSTTGHYAPFFTNRRYFYNFSQYYELADYVLVSSGELRDPHSNSDLKEVYIKLTKDPRYEIVSKGKKLEVYRRRLRV